MKNGKNLYVFLNSVKKGYPSTALLGGLSIRMSDALLKKLITITSLKFITHLVKIIPKSLTQISYSSIKEGAISELDPSG